MSVYSAQDVSQMGTNDDHRERRKVSKAMENLTLWRLQWLKTGKRMQTYGDFSCQTHTNNSWEKCKGKQYWPIVCKCHLEWNGYCCLMKLRSINLFKSWKDCRIMHWTILNTNLLQILVLLIDLCDFQT